MRVSVFGLGYVGSVTAAALAKAGHEVLGVDVQEVKVAAIEGGRAPIREPGLDGLVAAGRARGRLRATSDHEAAASTCEVALVCVGTPSRAGGEPDTAALERCLQAIGRALAGQPGPCTVAVRSTVLPGTHRRLLGPLLEQTAGRSPADGVRLVHNPEFMREASAIEDFQAPAKIVVGALEPAHAAPLRTLYAGINAPLVTTDFETAELAKYVDNAWHALKVGFANEVGRLGKAVGVDSQRAMELLRLDRRLNISDSYLQPGFAFGGSCLPKDLRAMTALARQRDVAVPILSSVLDSNRRHLDLVLRRIEAHGVARIGVIGLSFKPGTDDLRESPVVEVIERLLERGHEVVVHDPEIDPAGLVGTNRAFALAHLPHVRNLLAPDLEAAVRHGDLVLICHVPPEQEETLCRLLAGHRPPAILDCVRLGPEAERLPGYEGLCW